MSSEQSPLFQSFDLRGLELQNRIVLAPMTRARAGSDRIPNEVMAEYYAQRAEAGLLITEATTISPQGNGWVDSPGVYTEEQIQGWKQVVDAVHAKGAPIFLQLWHCGRASHSEFHGGELPVSASAIKNGGEYVHTPSGKKDYEVPRPLETSEIPGLIQNYVKATEAAKSVGFDGVEVHSANGYLLDQFLQSKTNERTDEYGGNIENRTRLLLEVVEAVSKVYGGERVGVRLSPNGVFNDMGSEDYREQFTYAASKLNEMGLAYLHVMDGLGFGFHELGEPMTLADFRKVFDGPLIGNCGYDQESATQRIGDGDADLIAIGRPFISNPDLVRRYREGLDLNAEAPVETWYAGGSTAAGYTDWPMAKQ